MDKAYKIIVKKLNKTNVFWGVLGDSLLELLQKNGSYLPALCNGRGTCGKCKIRVVQGELPITEQDKKCFTAEELYAGVRLACKAEVTQDLVIEITDTEDTMSVENVDSRREETEPFDRTDDDAKQYLLAIDIGTTTIACALVDSDTGEVCKTYSGINHQRSFGADVISRIAAANEGKLSELKATVEEDLRQAILSFGQVNIERIIIAGNTTMIHLLLGYSCESLGKFPFISEHLQEHSLTLQNIPVTILPGISAFVGADIVSDLMVCPGFGTEGISLLLDLGTNGEMVIGNRDRMLSFSTAAGPAFEGANISHGTGSIPGAISQVKIQNQRAVVRTIGEAQIPTGICGSGLISAIAELLRNRLIDKEGRLQYPYAKQDYPLWISPDGSKITLSQQDVRQFQMAKAAIRAGIELLAEHYGCTMAEVKQIYLAGGFGKGLNVEDAITTGILPEEFADKVEAVGNGSLKGCIAYGLGRGKLPDFSKIETLSLAEADSFNELYIKYMNF